MSTATKCSATTKAGTPCRMPAIAGTPHCFAHAAGADAAATRQAARVAGGKARTQQFARVSTAGQLATNPPTWFRMETASDVCGGLAFVAREVLLGRLSARDANAAIHALTALQPAFKDADLEERMNLIEGAIGLAPSRLRR